MRRVVGELIGGICLIGVLSCSACDEAGAGPEERDGGGDSGMTAAGPDGRGGFDDPTGLFSPEEFDEITGLSPLGPPPDDPTNDYGDDPKAAHFGQYLFFEERLSGNGKVSCATCHKPDHGFADPDRLSEGVGTTRRHTPTLLNTAYNRWYFWDGRADTLWAQVHSPLEALNEHGIGRVEVAHVIYQAPKLREAYETIFGEMPPMSKAARFPESGRPVPSDPDDEEHRRWMSMSREDRRAVNRVLANISKAIAAYETKLVSKNSDFDRFVEGLREGDAGKLEALGESERRGLKLFVGKAGCTTCHHGPLLSDREFHNIGLRGWFEPGNPGRYDGVEIVKSDPFNAIGPYSDAPDSEAGDEIRYLVQKQENRGQFKTPTLRNVGRTAPYMHGAHFENLKEVVRFYSNLSPRVQAGHREESLETFEISDREVADLVAFLKSLNGEPVPEELKRQPAQPLP